jgi:hypothetical protein
MPFGLTSRIRRALQIVGHEPLADGLFALIETFTLVRKHSEQFLSDFYAKHVTMHPLVGCYVVCFGLLFFTF